MEICFGITLVLFAGVLCWAVSSDAKNGKLIDENYDLERKLYSEKTSYDMLLQKLDMLRYNDPRKYSSDLLLEIHKIPLLRYHKLHKNEYRFDTPIGEIGFRRKELNCSQLLKNVLEEESSLEKLVSKYNELKRIENEKSKT